MKNRWKIISAVVMGIFLLTLAAVPALAQTTATRDIADQTLNPGESTNVTVTINNAQIQGLGLDEDPPAGWTVAEVDNGGGQYNATLIEWFWMQAAAGTTTVTYSLTVPLGAAGGVYEIEGTLFSNEGTVAIGGESQITVSGAAPPTDTTATRDIADQTLNPGESTNVTVTINNAQIQGLGLDEDPPAGWTVTEVDNGGGQYNATLIEWFWMQAVAGTITVTYSLTVPLGAAGGVYEIEGTLFSNEGTVAIGGESQITVSGAAPPADTTATRDIADQTLNPGESTNVTVTIDNAQIQGLGLDEDPPAGWTVAEVDNGGGQYNATLIEWFWMQAAVGTVNVTYNLTVPLDTPYGVYEIEGTLFSNEGTVAVGGETQITVLPTVLPAIRDIADQTLAPGESTNVTVTIDNAQAQSLGLDEDPPAGWTVTEVDNGGGQYNATAIEWFWMEAAAGTVNVVYNLTVPVGTAAGTYEIAGILFSSEGNVPIGGETQITVSGAPPPGDTTATRNIADQTLAPGESTNVTVTIDNAQLQALGLDEDPPAGWTVAAVNNGGAQYNATLIEWSWTEATAGTITVTYNVTAPAGTADGPYTISGTLVSDEGTVAVGGETTITVSTAPELVELTFTGNLSQDERETLLTPDIPAGVTALDIQLDGTADLDLELWDGSTHVIGWKAEISSKGTSTGTYSGDTFGYSGWTGGDEYITSDGPLGQAYGLAVYGFETGDYVVTVSYVPAGPDFAPPEITITAPDATVGVATTITVSASDPSGVELLWFAVWPDEYPPEFTGDQGPVATMITYTDTGSVTFVPGWAGIYIVEAWAEDTVGNITAEGAPETATFEVTE